MLSEFLTIGLICGVLGSTVAIIFGKLILHNTFNSQQEVSIYIWLGGVILPIIICGILAIILSSADSFLHSFGLIVTNDIIINELLFNPFPDGSDFLESYQTIQEAVLRPWPQKLDGRHVRSLLRQKQPWQ